jgi:hypothetical protein
MARITLTWRDDDESALSFTTDLAAAGADAQAIRQAFKQAGIRRNGSRWIVAEEIEEAAQAIRQLERDGHKIEHDGDSAMILDRFERIERREEHNIKFHGRPTL